jgi:hypothetical protein
MRFFPSISLKITSSFFLLDDMSNNSINRELKLHSPAGVEPAVFTWPTADRQVIK